MFLLTCSLVIAAVPAFSQYADKPAALPLKYKFTQGDQFEVTQHEQQESYLSLDGVTQRTSNRRDAVLVLILRQVSATEATIDASFKQITLLSSSEDQKISVNTTTGDNSLYNRLFKALTGKTFTLVLQQNGTIKSVTGLNPIFDDMIAAVPEVKADEKPILKKFLESQFGPEALKASLGLVMPYYPPQAVQVNDSWMNQLYTSDFYHGRIDNFWKLSYGDKYSAKLSNAGKFTTDASEEVDLGGGDRGFVDLSGEITGNYVVDPQTGWPSMCITHTELNGNYIYKAAKKRKQDIKVPVRVVMNASYQFKHL
jgi:hypothetical protein